MLPFKTDDRLALLEEATLQDGFSSRLTDRERHKDACYLYDNFADPGRRSRVHRD
jgi:hypothetical protein